MNRIEPEEAREMESILLAIASESSTASLFKAIRKIRKLSMSDVAAISGVNRNTIGSIENAILDLQHERDDLKHELDRLNAEIKTTDDLLKEATETIGAVVACCTYNSNEDAKIGVYGIDQKAFSRIDQFMTHYNDAVSAGKVSVDVKRELSDAEINELGAQEAEKRGEK